jgi:hypothetical protein
MVVLLWLTLDIPLVTTIIRHTYIGRIPFITGIILIDFMAGVAVMACVSVGEGITIGMVDTAGTAGALIGVGILEGEVDSDISATNHAQRITPEDCMVWLLFLIMPQFSKPL